MSPEIIYCGNDSIFYLYGTESAGRSANNSLTHRLFYLSVATFPGPGHGTSGVRPGDAGPPPGPGRRRARTGRPGVTRKRAAAGPRNPPRPCGARGEFSNIKRKEDRAVFTSTSQAESLTAPLSQGSETEVRGASPQSVRAHRVAEGAGATLHAECQMPSSLNVFNI